MTRDEAEDIKRHFNVISEGLRSDVRLVAEGHSVLDRKLDAVHQEISDFRRESLDFQKQAALRTRLDQADGKRA